MQNEDNIKEDLHFAEMHVVFKVQASVHKPPWY